MNLFGYSISNHALSRAIQRNISIEDMRSILTNGDWTHDPDSKRIIFFSENTNIELVCATDKKLVITVQRRRAR